MQLLNLQQSLLQLFIVIDTNGNQKFFKRFDNLNEVINLGLIKNGDLIIIAGNGEIAITKS